MGYLSNFSNHLCTIKNECPLSEPFSNWDALIRYELFQSEMREGLLIEGLLVDSSSLRITKTGKNKAGKVDGGKNLRVFGQYI